MSEEILLAAADRAAALAAIRARWAGVTAQFDIDYDGLARRGVRLSPPEAALLDLFGHAPADIAALLDRIDAEHSALAVFYQMVLDIKAAIDDGDDDESIDLDPYILRAAAALRGTP